MPVPLTYPGVYIEELPSGVRTITGVATSITAFLGRTLRGTPNEPVAINSFADFERQFGGLWAGSPMTYAVRDFYRNGGTQSVIVRVYNKGTEAEDTAGVALPTDDPDSSFIVQASSPGRWGDGLRVRVDYDVADLASTTLFNLTIRDDMTGRIETLRNLSIEADHPRRADKVINESFLVRATAPPGPHRRPIPHTTPTAAAPLWGDNGTNSKFNTANVDLPSDGASFTLHAMLQGNSLRARVDHPAEDPSPTTLFNLTIRDDTTGRIESFPNLSIEADHPRRADKIINDKSSLVRAFAAPDPANRPTAHRDPTEDEPLWGDNNTNSKFSGAVAGTDGIVLGENDYTGPGRESNKTGLYALEKVDLFNLLCIPPHGGDDPTREDLETTLIGTAAAYCEKRRAVLLVDPPATWNDKDDARNGVAAIGTSSNHAALYFPRLRAPNPLRDNQVEDFAPCGAVAGIIGRIDAQRGVWKAPAGLEATIVGAPALSVPVTDAENGELNPLGVNCLRAMPAAGRVVWGARTLQGADRLASEWKYLPVRRTALFIEESLYRGTQWVVFEPNAEPLWAQIRLNLGAFMNRLFRQGAFAGSTPREAYFVKCDSQTTTPTDVNLGVVNIVVGFAPLKPAEFVVIQLQQMAGQIAT
ncbi:phage tail sheath family protein [Nocardia gipuzkoensis]